MRDEQSHEGGDGRKERRSEPNPRRFNISCGGELPRRDREMIETGYNIDRVEVTVK